MLDVKMMMQSRLQTRGCTLRKGIRHDAVVREIPSATAVLFRDEFGMTLPLRYNLPDGLLISIACLDGCLRMNARSKAVDQASFAPIGPNVSGFFGV
jgi:hypothetical protein